MVAFGISLLSVASAQEETPQVQPPAPKPVGYMKSKTDEELKTAFDEAIEEMRSVVKNIRRSGMMHYFSDSDTAVEHRAEWEKNADRGLELYEILRDTSFEMFLRAKDPDNELTAIVRGMSGKLYTQGRYGLCYELTKKLAKELSDIKDVQRDLARIAIMTNHFDEAAEFARFNRNALGEFTKIEQILFDQLELLQANMEKELAAREADSKAEEPLPLVKLEIKGKGEIIIELFEDDAPETVGNFISLVDAGFYDEMIFHKVLKGMMAESGLTTMTRQRPVGYTIYDEHKRPDRRHHFRGSVSMFKDYDRDDCAGARFSIQKIPTPGLDPYQTVFGRVISGMDVVDALQETMEINEEEKKEEWIKGVVPDTLVSATVIRRRKHDNYEPNRVKIPESAKSTESAKSSD